MADDLVKKYGKEAFISGSDFVDNCSSKLVSVSPKLDVILGGGIPQGSFVILSGPPKVGKTVTALQICANAQKLEMPVYYINIEGRLKKRDLEGIKGLDIPKMEIVRSYRDEKTGKSKIFAAHEFLDIAERRVKEVPECVVVLDSVSQLISEKELEDNMGDVQVAAGPRLLGQFCKRISNVIPITNCIVISICHMTANINPQAKKKKIRSGGNKIGYQVDVDLEAKYSSAWKVAEQQIGQKVEWITGSTSIAPPGMSVQSSIRYGIGIDRVDEIVDLAEMCGFIQKGGAWYEVEGLESKLQGKEKVVQYLNENPELVDELEVKIREMLIG